ncbi:MAG: ricin-type beta-trefoil lectin domain protein [Candidatus Thiodiazotropha sp.]
MIRSMQDPHYCLDNSGSYVNGANIIIWSCTGSSNQRFRVEPASGKIAMRNAPTQVLDASSPDAGANVITWYFWNGSNQRWSLEP